MSIPNIATLIFFVLAFPVCNWAQVDSETKNKNYEELAYIDAINTYEKKIANGQGSAVSYKYLGNAYYYNGMLDKAYVAYSKLYEIATEIDSETLFRFSHTLKAQGYYEKSDEIMDHLTRENGNEQLVELFSKNTNYLSDIKENSGRYTIQNHELNSAYSDFAPSFYNEALMFSSARDTGRVSKIVHKWDNSNFNDLYVAYSKNGKQVLRKTRKSLKKLNSKFEESTTVFTKDCKTVYFTRSNYVKGNLKKDEKGVVRLKILKAIIDEKGKWGNIEELPINSDQYSVAHPALNVDDTKLYFASDMPGSYGLSDIYVVDIYVDGSFGKPKNLGNKINTPVRETFPFISESGDLYFAGDGHIGLGGLDIFVAKLESPSTIGKIYNLGEPINSSFDDFSFIINEENRTGYFASNRKGGRGSDDIYSFVEEKPLVLKESLQGVVMDKATGELISDISILVQLDNNTMLDVLTDKLGVFILPDLKRETNYIIIASKQGYQTVKQEALFDLERPLTLLIEKVKNDSVVSQGEDLTNRLQIAPIYFAYNKYNIRSDAKMELDKVVYYMNKYLEADISIESHTDSRGSINYNQKLATNRATSTLEYLVSKGISRKRLKAKGFGESRPKVDCEIGVICTKKEHQKNRRSEFIVK